MHIISEIKRFRCTISQFRLSRNLRPVGCGTTRAADFRIFLRKCIFSAKICTNIVRKSAARLHSLREWRYIHVALRAVPYYGTARIPGNRGQASNSSMPGNRSCAGEPAVYKRCEEQVQSEAPNFGTGAAFKNDRVLSFSRHSSLSDVSKTRTSVIFAICKK